MSVEDFLEKLEKRAPEGSAQTVAADRQRLEYRVTGDGVWEALTPVWLVRVTWDLGWGGQLRLGFLVPGRPDLKPPTEADVITKALMAARDEAPSAGLFPGPKSLVIDEIVRLHTDPWADDAWAIRKEADPC